jgi:hypothetical protein
MADGQHEGRLPCLENRRGRENRTGMKCEREILQDTVPSEVFTEKGLGQGGDQ